MTKGQMIAKIVRYNREFKYFGEENEMELISNLSDMTDEQVWIYYQEEVEQYGEI